MKQVDKYAIAFDHNSNNWFVINKSGKYKFYAKIKKSNILDIKQEYFQNRKNKT